MYIDRELDGRKIRNFVLSESFISEFRGKQPEWGPLGLVTYKRTYARPKDEGQSEEYWETCKRVVEGVYNLQKQHCRHLRLPWDDRKAQSSAQEMFTRMWEFKFTPPGRGLWMMGTDMMYEKGSAALNNCAFVSTEDIQTDFAAPFCFLMDMSMLGVGVGGDTLGKGTVKLIQPKVSEDVHVVPDTREGWVEILRIVLNAFVGKGYMPSEIDYSEIRPYGSPINGFGGVASGPDPLISMIDSIKKLLMPESEEPTLITSSQIVDIFNYIGKCVVAGNVRRSAEIMFGEPDDHEFVTLKQDKEALMDRH